MLLEFTSINSPTNTPKAFPFFVIFVKLLQTTHSMRVVFTKSVALLLFLFFANTSHAQFIGIPSIKHYSRADYQGGTQNWAITQSRNGLMYVANNNGLLEYDGSQWTLHQLGVGVTRTAKNIDGRIYTSNYNQLGYFDNTNQQQLKYTSLYSDDTGGEVWNVSSWQEGIVFQSDKKILTFKNDSLVSEIKAQTRFKSTHKAKGMMLVHQDGIGMMELRGNALFAINGGELFADKQITGIIEQTNETAIIFTLNNGMYTWSSTGIKAWNVSSNNLLKEYNIYTVTQYHDDCILIGTIQSGLVAIDAQGTIILHLNKDNGLRNNTILSLFVDADKNLWCGLDNGITHVQMNTSISYLQSHANIGTIYVIKKYGTDLYFGTNQGLYKTTEEEFYNPRKKAKLVQVPGTRGQVWSLHLADDKLLCGHNLGIFEINKTKVRKISPTELEGAWIFKPFPNDPQKILVGTYEGFCVLQNQNNSWQFAHKVQGYDHSARFVEFDKKGRVWVTHGNEGLSRIHFDENYQKIDSIQNYHFSDIAPNVEVAMVGKLKDNCTFFCNQGFFQWDDESRTFKPDLEFHKYFEKGKFPHQTMLDTYQNLWFYQSGQVGVLRRLEDGNYQKISNPFHEIKDKLIAGFEFLYVVNDKEVIFAIEDGIAYYSSSIVRNFSTHLNLNLRTFRSTSDSISYSLWQIDGHNQSQITKPTFAYDQNSFAIKYSVPQYTKEKIFYSSMLKGYDTNMSEWSMRNYREYSNIPTGNYTFVVQAKDENELGSKPLEFHFVVLPPWYLSIWAKILYFFLAGMLIFLFYFMLERRVKYKQRIEKDKQKERFQRKEELLKKETLEAEREIIRLRNETLQTQIEHKEKELANTTLNVIKKNDFLLEVKEKLQEMRKSKHANSQIYNMVTQLISSINRDIENDNHWALFETHLDMVHQDFLLRLRQRHPNLKKREEQLMAYIRMGMSSKEIASLLNISVRSVENNRSRLRNKIKLNAQTNFREYVLGI